MATILAFQVREPLLPKPPKNETAEVVIFPGVRYEYRDDEDDHDLARETSAPVYRDWLILED